METVCKLDQNDPDILGHRQKHLPEILCLLLRFGSLVVKLPDFCHSIDQCQNLFPEFLFDEVGRKGRIFQRVMEKCRDQAGRIDLHRCQDQGDIQGMIHI